jgi:hypothetical protein
MQMHQLDMRVRKMLQTLRELIVRKSEMADGILARVRDGGEWAPFENGGIVHYPVPKVNGAGRSSAALT